MRPRESRATLPGRSTEGRSAPAASRLELETWAWALRHRVPGLSGALSLAIAEAIVPGLRLNTAPDAAETDVAGPYLVAWRHGYRTGIAQAIERLRRLGGAREGPCIELEDAIRMLEAWGADLG